MSNASTLTLRETVSSKTFDELRSLWSTTAKLTGHKFRLLTELSLPSLTQKDKKKEKFSILVGSIFQALLIGESEKKRDSYKIKISFDSETIDKYCKKIFFLDNKNAKINLDSPKNLSEELSTNLDCLNRFIQKISNTLTKNNRDKYQFLLAPEPLKNIVQYQAEQQKILDLVKIKIDRHVDLLEIVKMTIEQVRHLLELDRLVIYQLNVTVSTKQGQYISPQVVDTVVYESRANDDIPSILYFHDETCFTRSTECRNKYHKGFSLAVNDIEQYPGFPECLKALMRKLQIRAKLVTPIIVKNELWGFTIAHQCFAPRQWNDTQIRFMEQIAEYLAIAIEQNQSYQQLQQQKEQLEQQVKTRKQQLKDALIAAKAASQSKHEFIGNMSHELRTPLTCVIGLSSTLLHWSLAGDRIPLPLEKQQQYLKTIHDSGKHLLSLINNILEFSEVESGRFLLNITEFSLQNLAYNVLRNLQDEAYHQKISLGLDFNVAPEEDRFCADRERVQEILLNLLSNAIKFTPAGGQAILRIWRENNQVIFEVEDTGIGIAEQQLPMLFESFQQLENSRQRTHGGTGLGLALTKQLIELHHGTIEVESIVGEGSVFTVCLPNQVSIKRNDRSKTSFSGKLKIQPKNIILVSQEEENSTEICQLLTAAGYQVVWLIDPSTAINQIQLLEPRVVILDRDLSDSDIINLNKGLQDTRAVKVVKLILFAFEVLSHEWQYFSSIGMDGYLLKSMSSDSFLEKIEAAIEQVE
ncbi:MAG: ATP-binding protein [Xenococcaceae cyanobacterium]